MKNLGHYFNNHFGDVILDRDSQIIELVLEEHHGKSTMELYGDKNHPIELQKFQEKKDNVIQYKQDHETSTSNVDIINTDNVDTNKIDIIKNYRSISRVTITSKPMNRIGTGYKKVIFSIAILMMLSIITLSSHPSASAKELDLDINVHHDGAGIAEICLDSKQHEKNCEQYELDRYQDPFVIPYKIEDSKPNKEYKLCYKIEQENQEGCNTFKSGENYQQTDLYLPVNELANTDENAFDIYNTSGPIREPLKEVITYRNSEYNLKIDYPISYEKVVKDFDPDDRVIDIVTFYQPFKEVTDKHQEYYSVVMDPLPYQRSLNEYLIETIKDYSVTYSNFIEIESNTNSYLSGHPAYKLIYTYRETNSGMDMRAMEIGTIVDNKVYYIEYQAEESEFDKYISNIEYWINSFQIL